MSRRALQRLLVVYAAVVLVGVAWFWARQVQSVIDLLRMAYG